MKTDVLWDNERSIIEQYPGIEVPEWIDQHICPHTVAAIVEGGCASGAYMPAVTYYEAAQTMAEHGDDVLEFIVAWYGELPATPNDTSWSYLACLYLSYAVEAWAASIEYRLADAIIAEYEPDDEA